MQHCGSLWSLSPCTTTSHSSLTLACFQVLMGAHALLANGGVMAPSGAHMVALAAKRHSVPFVVLAGLHKLSPLFPHDPSVTFNDFKAAPCTCPFLSFPAHLALSSGLIKERFGGVLLVSLTNVGNWVAGGMPGWQ